MKKLLAAILAAILPFILSIAAFAENTDSAAASTELAATTQEAVNSGMRSYYIVFLILIVLAGFVAFVLPKLKKSGTGKRTKQGK